MAAASPSSDQMYEHLALVPESICAAEDHQRVITLQG
jgi:hypothetical protein